MNKVSKVIFVICVYIIIIFITQACSPSSNEIPTITYTSPPHEKNNTPTTYSGPTPHKIKTPTLKVIQNADYPLCSSVYIGYSMTCKIPRAYCSYEPGVNGQPTFCNDARYPNHSFTLLVWGQDWSRYDGHCLLVTGVVEYYRGRAEIEATSSSQVSTCK